jgi:four helix bundle protein
MADNFRQRQTGFRDYRDLEVWQLAIRLHKLVAKITRNLPMADRMVFEVQMRRAALSIAANIAEGQQRHHLGDYLHHVSFARGSAGELQTFLIAMRESEIGPEGEVAEAQGLTESVSRMLSSMGASLRRNWVRGRASRPKVAISHQP